MSDIINKQKARWLPPFGKFSKQIIISAWSYISLPFFREKPNGVYNFFTNQYSGSKDLFVFDGNSSSYYNQALRIINSEILNSSFIIDLGCGEGSLYYCLIDKKITPRKYIGVDFAAPARVISESASIEHSSIDQWLSLFIREDEGSHLVFMSNSLCYCSDKTFNSVLSFCNQNDYIVIIEPSQSLFWDAHFNGVKPTYRSFNTVKKNLINLDYKIIDTSADYLFSNSFLNLFMLSYCIIAQKA